MKLRTLIPAVVLSISSGTVWAFHGGGWSGGGDRGGSSGGSNTSSPSSTDNSHFSGGGHSSSNGGSRSGGSAGYRGGRSYGGNSWRSGRGGNYGNYNRFNRSYRSYRNGYGSYHSFNHSNGFNGRTYNSNGWNRTGQGLHYFNHNGALASNSQAYHSYGSYGRNNFSTSPSSKLRAMGITHVPQPRSGKTMLSSSLPQHTPHLPSQGPGGKPFSSHGISPSRMNSPAVRNQMATIVGNHGFMAKVAANTQVAGRANHYYWNNLNGFNYCNYYDGYGNCWYGWDCGAGFFWSQYYCGNWWWYDPWWGNWCWWDNGNWWWENPATTTVYVYNNGNYVPAAGDGSYAQGDDDYNPPAENDGRPEGGYSNQPNGGEPQNYSYNEPAENNPSLAGSVIFRSDDDSRSVKLVGDAGDAFLFTENSKSSKPVFLDTGVQEVRFIGSGKDLRIQLTLRDGSMEIFKADGLPVHSANT